ncbi:hypothetical protein BJ742DRAFT_740458 [Cladochytrium replicatum]|nr:hypothetical protein BJ742DRAFT_740458 [Cladochytrium replicatum]
MRRLPSWPYFVQCFFVLLKTLPGANGGRGPDQREYWIEVQGLGHLRRYISFNYPRRDARELTYRVVDYFTYANRMNDEQRRNEYTQLAESASTASHSKESEQSSLEAGGSLDNLLCSTKRLPALRIRSVSFEWTNSWERMRKDGTIYIFVTILVTLLKIGLAFFPGVIWLQKINPRKGVSVIMSDSPSEEVLLSVAYSHSHGGSSYQQVDEANVGSESCEEAKVDLHIRAPETL